MKTVVSKSGETVLGTRPDSVVPRPALIRGQVWTPFHGTSWGGLNGPWFLQGGNSYWGLPCPLWDLARIRYKDFDDGEHQDDPVQVPCLKEQKSGEQ